MVRELNTVLQKDAMCMLSIPNDKTYRKWLDAVGTCGGILNSGVPVLSSFYAAYRRYGSKCSDGMMNYTFRNTSMVERLGQKHTLQDGLITAEARASFYVAFGVLPDEQCALERMYDHARINAWVGDPIERADVQFVMEAQLDRV